MITENNPPAGNNARFQPLHASPCENSVVPPGLESFFPLFPALPRWAKLDRPLPGWISQNAFHPILQRSSQADLKCWANLIRSFGAGFSQSSFRPIIAKGVVTQTPAPWAAFLGRYAAREGLCNSTFCGDSEFAHTLQRRRHLFQLYEKQNEDCPNPDG